MAPSKLQPPRLRQVALVASELGPAMANLRDALELGEPFHDPAVGEFGLENAVFAAGDTFVELVTPVRDDTTAGRYLEKRGGDSGYMAIFQVPDTPTARRRATQLGVRIVWQADLDDIAGTHFHPKDVAGAIVSVDTPRPPETWRWGGPAWTGQVPNHDGAGIVGLGVECADPERAAWTWGALLDVQPDGPSLTIDDGRQEITFHEGDKGIVAVVLRQLSEPQQLCGVTFRGRR